MSGLQAAKYGSRQRLKAALWFALKPTGVALFTTSTRNGGAAGNATVSGRLQVTMTRFSDGGRSRARSSSRSLTIADCPCETTDRQTPALDGSTGA